MRALLVANPAATTTTTRAREVIARALASDLKIDTVSTEGRGHAAELARQARADGVDVVVVLGGDGTVNEAVNGLLADGPIGAGPALAVVPGGSTNVFARALGLPGEPVEATGQLLEALREGRRRRVSLGRVDGRWFTFTAGIGLDAAVVERVEAARAAGTVSTPALYIRSAVRELSGRNGVPLTLEQPGRDPVEGLRLAVVANTRPWTYLGRRPIDPYPEAALDAGLAVFGLRSVRPLPVARTAAQLLSGRRPPHGRQVITVGNVSRVTLTAYSDVPLQVDGDYVGRSRRFVVESVLAALPVLT
ncbi:diacylglycerol/lipid kinase family protein [Motilibacter aurantiacus]|uniref:diacylglycerol/lipid kinase family protein n=1 Tax=Motilibacter aurantiacus TaxID=2714955 RepID=UPI0014082ABF|nr:diacylglycerol kinase family protein [Motilibacter aurantiacus]NHC43710.1 diacylglycerol kinase family lipid kinase [Motilibacter aurantiacus]